MSFLPSTIKPGRPPFPVHPVANDGRLWIAQLHCGNRPGSTSLPALSSLLLSNSCSRLVSQIVIPILPLCFSQLILVSPVEPERSPRTSSHIFPAACFNSLCSPCLYFSPTQNTNLDINSFGCLPRYIYPYQVPEGRGLGSISKEEGWRSIWNGTQRPIWPTDRKSHTHEVKSH